MRILINLFLTTFFIVLIYSCGENPDLKEINRSMEDITRRMERMNTVVGNLTSKEIKEQKELFTWHLEEFESLLGRLKTEYSDVMKSENEGAYDEKEVRDVLAIATTMKQDAEKFRQKTEEVVKMLELAGPADMKEECMKLQEEIKKFDDEIGRLEKSFGYLLKTDSDSTGTPDGEGGDNNNDVDENETPEGQ